MQFEKIHNKGQAQLFKNPWLEMLTKTHPLVIWGMYTPVIIYMLYYSGNSLGFTTTWILLTFLGGMFFWTLFEYIAHRFLFHMIANSGRAKKFVYTLHGNHHHYKNEHNGYGVSSTIWDHIFGTMFDLKNEKEDKEKVKELMFEKKD